MPDVSVIQHPCATPLLGSPFKWNSIAISFCWRNIQIIQPCPFFGRNCQWRFIVSVNNSFKPSAFGLQFLPTFRDKCLTVGCLSTAILFRPRYGLEAILTHFRLLSAPQFGQFIMMLENSPTPMYFYPNGGCQEILKMAYLRIKLRGFLFQLAQGVALANRMFLSNVK